MSVMNSVASTPVNREVVNLPRLLYVGDVPVDASVGGSALIYRLLLDYPTDRLRIWESNIQERKPESRLPGVRYESFISGVPRLLKNRWEHRGRAIMFRFAPAVGRRLARRAQRDQWRPQAILTVAHGMAWLSAFEVARALRVPLHLIVHDEIHYASRIGPENYARFDRAFGEVWRQAASRLCVCPFMADKYTSEFGGQADVLYPSRPRGGPEFDQPPAHVAEHRPQLNFVYAGSIWMRDYARMLGCLSRVLAERGHRLTCFTNLTPESAREHGLNQPHVTINGLIPREELIQRMNREADVLFVPMSFAAEDRPNMEISFPSKMTDCTASGVPLLVQGPDYCSAVRWSKSSPPRAEVIDLDDQKALAAAVARLEDPAHRQRLAVAAIEAGKACFSHESAVGTLTHYLCASAVRG